MGYKALRTIKNLNKSRFGINSPIESPSDLVSNDNNLMVNCLNFIREDCENLHYDKSKVNCEDSEGKSSSLNQIPINMEKDINRLCLENAIINFIKTGTTEDAFLIYFIFIEMFLGKYHDYKKFVESFIEFEQNSSVLLMKHRDHYVHSTYVFLLGIALYHSNSFIRNGFNKYYKISNRDAAHAFLKNWGLTALFHDIGYPFELAFEQLRNYFNEDATNNPHIIYDGIDPFIKFNNSEAFTNLNEFLSHDITEKLYESHGNGETKSEFYNLILKTLNERPTKPGEHMDHAYFSSIVLTRKFDDLIGWENLESITHDAISAIALHNGLFWESIQKFRQVDAKLKISHHPLAYLLILCDELQSWDRISYGQNSRGKLYPFQCNFEFEDKSFHVEYLFDKALTDKNNLKDSSYEEMKTNSNFESEYVSNISKMIEINTSDSIYVNTEATIAKNNYLKHEYMSKSNFMHLYNFAVVLNSRFYNADKLNNISVADMECEFDKLSIEYKVSNILQAKAFERYLEEIDCFYSDRPVSYEIVKHFTKDDMDKIGPLEHQRWCEEKTAMGWVYGNEYEKLNNSDFDSKAIRELTRTHKLLIDKYENLPEEEQDKDTRPMDTMLELLSKYDGLRIYRL